MSLSRRNAKRDTIERSIIDALERVGCQVWQVSGPGLPDILTYRAGRWLPMEIKSGKAGTLTPRQGAFPLVRSVDEALALLGA